MVRSAGAVGQLPTGSGTPGPAAEIHQLSLHASGENHPIVLMMHVLAQAATARTIARLILMRPRGSTPQELAPMFGQGGGGNKVECLHGYAAIRRAGPA